MSNPSSTPVRRVHYCAKEKRKIIIFAEIHGNRSAEREFGVSECNVRLWRKNREKLFQCAGSRRSFRYSKPVYPEIEEVVVDYVADRRSRYLRVTRVGIREKALEIAKEKGIGNFRASDGWCTRFMERHAFSLRRRTSVCQKLPAAFEEQLISWQRFIISQRSKHMYPLAHIGNADETPVYFDMPDNATIEKVGAKEVKLLSTGYEKQRITVMLAVTADGSKLPPYLILRRKTLPKKEKFPRDVVVRVHPKGWMTSELMIDWIDMVWSRRPGGMHSPRSLLALDAFKGHLTNDVQSRLRKRNTDCAIIPGGMTSQLQPLDVSINKPFKNYLKHEYDEWLSSDGLPTTKTGKIRKAPPAVVAGWVSKAWKKVDPSIIQKSFKKCCISNALDGTEDDLLWQSEDDHSSSEDEEKRSDDSEDQESEDDEED